MKSLWNIAHPDTSFCMYTDRYPDSYHINFQTGNPARNVFSVRLKLANNLKNRTFMPPYRQALSLGRPTGTPWLSLLVVRAAFLLSSLCLTGFVAHSLALIRTFCQFRQYSGMTRCAQNIHERFWSNPGNFALTRPFQVKTRKVSIIGSIHRSLGSNSNVSWFPSDKALGARIRPYLVLYLYSNHQSYFFGQTKSQLFLKF